MKNTIVIAALSMLFVGGCKTTSIPVQIDRGLTANSHSKKIENLPDINSIKTITPGESMISSFEITVKDGIHLFETVRHTGTFNGFDNTYIVEPGDLPLMATNSRGKFYGGSGKLRHIVNASNTDHLVRWWNFYSV